MKPATETIAIRNASDVSLCRRRAAHLATSLGFPAVQVGEIAILASELAENVVKHGGSHGEMILAEITGLGGRGLEVTCSDTGPGFDADTAFRDGFSTTGTLGIGLGAVARLADVCDVSVPPGGVGARVVARKWLPAATIIVPEPATATSFEVGARSRPLPGHKVNGDAYAVRFLGADVALAAVIDGLGHGVEAHEAAIAARELIESEPNLDLEALFINLDRRLRRTRGAVIAIARIDPCAGRLRFVGVGNIEAVLFAASGAQQLVCTGGIVGHTMRTPHVFEHPWTPESALVLCSDGIRSAWRMDLDHALFDGHPDVLANVVLSGYARETDDATVLGIRQKRP